MALEGVDAARLVVTQEVLTEVLDAFSGLGRHYREAVTAAVRELLEGDEVEIVAQSQESFLTGLTLYEQRLDKRYSLVDCISFATMRRLGIADVLTTDRHFRSEGFNVLM